MIAKRFHATTSCPLPAPGNNLEIWIIDLNQPESFMATAGEFLPPEEMARSSRFRHLTARRNYLVAHSAMRRLLGAMLNLEPREIPLGTSPHGKPELAGALRGQLHFNLTHSGNLALLAVCADMEVGVDVERIRPVPDALRLATRFFTPTEAAALDKTPEPDRHLAFFRLWTRKEALVKATGEGIAHGLARFDVSVEADAGLKAIDGDATQAAQWTLHGFSPAEGYLAAAAVQRPDAQFFLHQYQFDHA